VISGKLFTRDYLLEGITRSAPWKGLTDGDVASLRAKLLKHAKSLLAVNKANEAQTEKIFIYPVLELLGWSDIEVQTTLSPKGRKHVPDALLFPDTDARDQAVAEKDQWKRFGYGLAIVEAKRWTRALDRADKRDAGEDGVPSMQIMQYLSRVDVVTSGKVRLGILTNGNKWRLYFQGALSVSDDYLEIDLAKALELPGHELDLVERADKTLTPDFTLRLFILLFSKQAFLPLDGVRTFHDLARDEGKIWEEKVTRDLSRLVFRDIYPSLVAALYRHDKGKPTTVDADYLEAIRQNALILLYRLLFVVYAEDRDLLPDAQEPYKSYSLTTMRQDIAERKAGGQPLSATIATYWPKLTAVFKAIADGDDVLGIPPYNGGLFARDSAPLLDRITLPDAVLADLIFKLSHRNDDDGTPRYINYRDLTVQHLGTIYERTLEYGLRYNPDDDVVEVDADDTARHESGSYYTPDSLVSLIIEKAVGPFVEERFERFRDEAAKLAKDKRPLEARLALLQGFDPALGILELRICDPSMGSGHFLVNLVDWLADKALAAIAEAEQIVEWSGDTPYRSPVLASIEQTRIDIIRQATIHKWPFVLEHLDPRHIVRRTILKRCIYGVDKNPMAVELAKVALWLHTFTVGAPLSFLDHHLRCGNSLFGFWVREAMDRLTKWGGQLLINEPMQKAMAQALAMQKLERVSDIDIAEVHQSKTLFDGIEQETRPLNSFIKILYALDWLKLDKDDESAVRTWLDGQFGDPFEIARGRYTLGPTDKGDGHAQPKDILSQVKTPEKPKAVRFAELLNQARALVRSERFQNWQVAFPGVWTQWESGVLHGGFHAVVGNPPYVRQELIKPYKAPLKRGFPDTYDGSADLYVYFYDQGLKLLKPGGRLSYVVTNKWMRAGYAEGLRGVLADKAWVEFVADFGHAKKFFPDADVFPSVLVIRKPNGSSKPAITNVCAMPRDDVPEMALDEAVAKATYPLPLTHFTKESWVLEPPEVAKLLEKLRHTTTPLTTSVGIKPYRGVLTGFNDAFLIDTATKDRIVAEDKSAAEIIKPYVRGQDLIRWAAPWSDTWMIFARRGINIDQYPSVKRHLSKFKEKLAPKPDGWEPSRPDEKWPGRKQGNYQWYEIQDAVDYWKMLEAPKILYPDIAWTACFSIDETGVFTNNTGYIIPAGDPWLLTVLNAPIGWWYAWRKAQHGKDEALRYFNTFIESYPVPQVPPQMAEVIASDVKRLSELVMAETRAEKLITSWLRHEWGLEDPKRALKKTGILDSEQFISAVRDALPRKRKLTATEIAELRREHVETIEPVRQARSEIFALETKLSDLVNEAYGLTPQDVDLMWRTAPPRMPFTPAGLTSVVESAEEETDEV
jgi:hypothetical protein